MTSIIYHMPTINDYGKVPDFIWRHFNSRHCVTNTGDYFLVSSSASCLDVSINFRICISAASKYSLMSDNSTSNHFSETCFFK